MALTSEKILEKIKNVFISAVWKALDGKLFPMFEKIRFIFESWVTVFVTELLTSVYYCASPFIYLYFFAKKESTTRL